MREIKVTELPKRTFLLALRDMKSILNKKLFDRK